MNMASIDQTITQSATSQREAATKGSEGGKKLGKQDFLNLMMTQMGHQDPLSPMDSNQMMQQFAAMGSMEQLQNLNEQVTELLAKQSDVVQATAYSFLGKDVELGSDTLRVQKGIATPGLYQLEGDADRVTIQVLDAHGEVVRSLTPGAQGRGSHQVVWDAKDDEGDAVPDKSYRYRVMAKTADGEVIGASQIKQGRVSAISFEKGRPLVKVNGEFLPLSSIKSLSNQSEQRFSQADPLPLKQGLLLKPMLPIGNVPPPLSGEASSPSKPVASGPSSALKP